METENCVNSKEKKVGAYGLFGCLILFLLIAIALWHILLPDSSYSPIEKRSLSVLPKLTADSLADGSFMARADDYAADHFPLRDIWMRVRSNTMRYLGETESQGVYYGRDGSLIQRFDSYHADRMKQTAEAVAGFTEQYAFDQVILLAVPTAASLYPEKLPPYAQTASEKAFWESFAALLPAGIKAPDSFSLMQQLKSRELKLYYGSDHHWTTPAACAFFDLLAEDFNWVKADYKAGIVSNSFLGSLAAKSGFTPPHMDEIVIYEKQAPAGAMLVNHTDRGVNRSSLYWPEALESSNQYEVFMGGNESLITIRTTADTEKTLLVFKDSYANCFIPFLTESYKSITVVDPRYFSDPVSTLFMQGAYNDLLILYNIQTLAEDESLQIVLRDIQP